MHTNTRQSHILLFGVAAAALAFVVAAPGAAQAQQGEEVSVPADPTLTEEQQAEHDSWTPEKQAEYAAWPADAKTYYWSLSEERQMMFWALADSDKIALSTMSETEREATWERIEQRAGPPPTAT